MKDGDRFGDNIILVENLNDFLSSISEIREQVKSEEGPEPSNQHFYFRGQANSDWDIFPSVYRGNLLASEPDLIRSAYLRNPVEFRTFTSNFERLTKLQHYGLPTRLLDVTTNPLVALYFACQPYDKIEEDEEASSKKIIPADGAVFYKRAYGRGYQDVEIETVALLSSLSIQGDLTLEKCLELLTENGLYSPATARECEKNSYKSIIESLQNNYFVISTLNNERLIRQSGAFLLPGHYNIYKNTNRIGESLIQRGMDNLNDEFEITRFIIPCERKAEILDELDLCNINEGSLFPELEHQMSYIKQRRIPIGISQIGKFNRMQETNESEESDRNNVYIENIDAEKIFSSVLSQHSIPSAYFQEALDTLKSDLCLDWYQKESVISTMRLHLTKLLSTKPEFDRHSAMDKAKDIMNAVLQEIKQ